jgi:DNA polymerase III epsilon subunit-like protein
MNNLLFIDLETTGTDPNSHSVIQIAAEFHQEGKPVKTFNRKLNPSGYKVSLGALRVNKVKYSQLNSLGNTDTVVAEFVDFLLGLNPKGQVTVVGHNVHFDMAFIKTLFTNHGIEDLNAVFSYRQLDTAAIAVFLQDVGILNIEKANLESLAKHFNVVKSNTDFLETNFHDAAFDTKTTVDVYNAMKEYVKSKTK